MLHKCWEFRRNEGASWCMAHLNLIRGIEATSSKKAERPSVAKLRAILEDEGMRQRGPKETFEAV